MQIVYCNLREVYHLTLFILPSNLPFIYIPSLLVFFYLIIYLYIYPLNICHLSFAFHHHHLSFIFYISPSPLSFTFLLSVFYLCPLSSTLYHNFYSLTFAIYLLLLSPAFIFTFNFCL